MVNIPNRPIQPGQPQQPISGTQGPSQAQPTQPTAPAQSAPTTPSAPPPPVQNNVQNHPASGFDPVSTVTPEELAARTQRLTTELSEPQDRTALLNAVNDGNAANDSTQFKMVVLRGVQDTFGPETKNRLAKILADPDNKAIYTKILDRAAATIRNLPPEQQQAALDNLIKTLASDAAKIVSGVPVPDPDDPTKKICDPGC